MISSEIALQAFSLVDGRGRAAGFGLFADRGGAGADGGAGTGLDPAALMPFAMTAMGLYMATIASTMPQFALLMMLVLLPLRALSSAMTPRESMAEIIQTIMLAAPNSHFVLLWQAILFRGAGFDIVWPQFPALAVIGSVLFRLALRRFCASLR